VRPVSRAPGDPGHDHPRPHLAELRGAIVQSGCYNRTLTPDGFQYERRSYWAVPDVYHAFSPLLFADRLDRPVLIVHEGHAFLFQGSHQAIVREHARWLRRCGGGGTRGTACRGIPSPPLR